MRPPDERSPSVIPLQPRAHSLTRFFGRPAALVRDPDASDFKQPAAGAPDFALVRRYIHDELLYRYIIVQDGKEALAIEAAIKSGAWGRGRPFLNPGRQTVEG